MIKIDFTEMRKLQRMLDEANIPYDIHKLFNGEQIEYFGHGDMFKDERVCDVICHEYSYGVEQGLLEMMGLCDTVDNVEGYLTAEEVFERIKKDWDK